MPDLPVLQPDEAPRERADAARNRLRILAAAAELVDERGIEHVSMEDVAQAACVGTGTLYRRFGDRSGLALALLDAHTREFQNAMIAGPPPLGPGAPPAERLRAFGEAFLDHVERHAELLVVAAPQLDAEFTARALLATLSPAQHLFARKGLGWELERLRAGWRGLVDALCD